MAGEMSARTTNHMQTDKYSTWKQKSVKQETDFCLNLFTVMKIENNAKSRYVRVLITHRMHKLYQNVGNLISFACDKTNSLQYP